MFLRHRLCLCAFFLKLTGDTHFGVASEDSKVTFIERKQVQDADTQCWQCLQHTFITLCCMSRRLQRVGLLPDATVTNTTAKGNAVQLLPQPDLIPPFAETKLAKNSMLKSSL